MEGYYETHLYVIKYIDKDKDVALNRFIQTFKELYEYLYKDTYSLDIDIAKDFKYLNQFNKNILNIEIYKYNNNLVKTIPVSKYEITDREMLSFAVSSMVRKTLEDDSKDMRYLINKFIDEVHIFKNHVPTKL